MGRRILFLCLITSLLLGLPAAVHAAESTAAFDWSMPDRLVDADGDGMLDYFSDLPSEAQQLAFIRPDSWPVTLDACASTPGATSYRWTVNGKPIEPTPVPASSCRFTYPFPYEGTFDVSLTVSAGGSLSQPLHREVLVQDWLVVSLGDSYASGEGAPDKEAPLVTPIWKDARCDRSANAAAAVAAHRLEVQDPRTSVTFVHLACSGATVMSGLLGPYEGANPPEELEPSAGNPFPCVTRRQGSDWVAVEPHAACLPPQVDRAAELIQDREIDALTLSIGGNDAHFADIVKSCIVIDPCWGRPFETIGDDLIDAFPAACLSGGLAAAYVCYELGEWVREERDEALATNRTAQDLINDGIDGFGAADPPAIYMGLRPLYDRLAAGLNDKLLDGGALAERVFQTEYVDATTGDDGSYCESESIFSLFHYPPYVTKTESIWVDNQVERRINAIIADNEERYGWTVVDGIHQAFQRHGLCSSDPYLRSLGDSLLYQQSEKGAVHPNTKGFRAMGNTLFGEMRRSLYGPCAPAPEEGAKVLEGEFTFSLSGSDRSREGLVVEESQEMTGRACILDPTGYQRLAEGSTWDLSYRLMQALDWGTCASTQTWQGNGSGGFASLIDPGENPSILHVESRGDDPTTPDSYRLFPHVGMTVPYRWTTTCPWPPDEPGESDVSARLPCFGEEGWATLTGETDETRSFRFSCRTTDEPGYSSRLEGTLIEWKNPPTHPKIRRPAIGPEQRCADGPTGEANEIVGTALPDILNGTPGDDVIFGLGANDTLNGGGGDDILCGGDDDDRADGGSGRDALVGGDGGDELTGGDGDDRIYGGNGDDRVSAGGGDDVVFGGAGIDQIDTGGGANHARGGPGNDRVTGGAGNDVILGGDHDDVLDGGAGADLIDGGSGDDLASGGAGVDRMYGSYGDDRLVGGPDPDWLDAGPGNDLCVSDGADFPSKGCEITVNAPSLPL